MFGLSETSRLSETLPRNSDSGTDSFNRVQLQLACEGSRPRPRVFVAERELLRVLIVDDNHDTTDVMSLLVWRWGHDVYGAYDGATALRSAALHAPHIVILDIAMPCMDGFQVAERLRANARLRDCFLIAMSGYTDTAHLERCGEVGIDLYLLKPVQNSLLETLLDLQCTRLGRSRRERGCGGVAPTIWSRNEGAEDPWDRVPGCNLITTAIL